jgi:hypothetical protein
MDWARIIEAAVPLIIALVSVIANGKKKDIKELADKLDKHIKDDEADKARQARIRILRFSDECAEGVRHSESLFDDILDDIDRYEAYCNAHPEFPNNKGRVAMERIKTIYEKCKRNNTFLK